MTWLPARGQKERSHALTPDEQAAHCLARRSLGLERRAPEGSSESPRGEAPYESALNNLDDLLEIVQEHAADPGIARMRAEALEVRGSRRLRWGPTHLGVAAALVVMLLMSGIWIGQQMKDHDRLGTPAGELAATVTAGASMAYETSRGEHRTVALADGSHLTLDTASRAEVTIEADARKVRLVRGQALFQVAKDPRRPFSVVAGTLNVIALGTTFDVRVERSQAKVVLVEGSVAVEPLMRRGVERLVPSLARRRLAPGQQLIARTTGEVSLGSVDIESANSWQSGRLIFRDEPLASAVAEFNRYNTKQLVIEDAALEHLTVSGVFTALRPDDFLAAIATFYAVQVDERGENAVILRLEPREHK
jgi:transmembrane sensor